MIINKNLVGFESGKSEKTCNSCEDNKKQKPVNLKSTGF